ncbi:MAG: hypothetical protein QW303_07645 [Nitrososphaerota archaeon]
MAIERVGRRFQIFRDKDNFNNMKGVFRVTLKGGEPNGILMTFKLESGTFDLLTNANFFRDFIFTRLGIDLYNTPFNLNTVVNFDIGYYGLVINFSGLNVFDKFIFTKYKLLLDIILYIKGDRPLLPNSLTLSDFIKKFLHKDLAARKSGYVNFTTNEFSQITFGNNSSYSDLLFDRVETISELDEHGYLGSPGNRTQGPGVLAKFPHIAAMPYMPYIGSNEYFDSSGNKIIEHTFESVSTNYFTLFESTSPYVFSKSYLTHPVFFYKNIDITSPNYNWISFQFFGTKLRIIFNLGSIQNLGPDIFRNRMKNYEDIWSIMHRYRFNIVLMFFVSLHYHVVKTESITQITNFIPHVDLYSVSEYVPYHLRS